MSPDEAHPHPPCDPTPHEPPRTAETQLTCARAGEGPGHEGAGQAPGVDDTFYSSDPAGTGTSPPRPAQPVPAERGLPQDFGDYELLEVLGQGGMGVVYKARHKKLSTLVALKRIRSSGLATEAEVERFLREVKIASGLLHPNLLPVHAYGEAGGEHFFTMPLVEGGTLQQRLAGGPLPPMLAADVTRQVAEAVQCAHDRGILHRDIKPHNILIHEPRRTPPSVPGGNTRPQAHSATLDDRPQAGETALVPMLMDFGLARAPEGGQSVTGDILGTPSYMAPEQASGNIRDVGRAADVYALGAVLYCLLTGRPPFQSSSPMETLRQVLEREPVPPRQMNAAIPRDLETVCLKCIQKEPQKRYPSAAALAEDLGRFLREEPVQARPVRGLERAVRWVRRRPLLATVYGLLVLVVGLGVGVGGVVHLWRRADESSRKAERAEQVARKERDLARRLQYAGDMNIAGHAWREGNLMFMDELLARHRPGQGREDLRNFEWHYLAGLRGRQAHVPGGHSGGVWGVTFTPDGRGLVSVGQDGSVLLRDADSGKVVKSLIPAGALLDGVPDLFQGPPVIHKAVFSPDGKRLALPSKRLEIRLLGYPRGESSMLEGHTGQVNDIVFTGDGTRLYSASDDGTIRTWAPDTGKQLRVLDGGHAGGVLCLALGRDDKTLVSGGKDSVVRVWEAAGGKLLGRLAAHQDVVTCLAFSPDGRLFASASLDQTVHLWDARTLQRLGSLRGHTGPVNAIAFSPDARSIASASWDQTVKVWDVETQQELRQHRGHVGRVADVAFSPDGSRVVSASQDGTLRFWDVVASPEATSCLGHASPVLSLAFNPAGTRLFSLEQAGAVRGWDVPAGHDVLRLSRRLPPVDGLLRLSRSSLAVPVAEQARLDHDATDAPRPHQTSLYPPPRGRSVPRPGWPTRRFTPPRPGPLVRWVDVARDDTQLLTIQGSSLQRWDARTGARREPTGETVKEEGGVVVCAANGWYATMDRDGTLWVRAAHANEPAYQSKIEETPASVVGGTIRPDGERVVLATSEKRVRVWNARTGAREAVYAGHAEAILTLAYSPGTTAVASAGADGVVKVWNPDDGSEIASLRGHSDSVNALAFSPDGQRLASGGSDGAVKVWDVVTGQLLLTLAAHRGAVLALAFSPGGEVLASGGADAVVRLWSGKSAPAALATGRTDQQRGMWHRREAELAERDGLWFAVAFHSSQCIERDPLSSDYRRRGRARAEQQQWAGAREDFSLVALRAESPLLDRCHLALAYVALDDVKAYRALASRILGQVRADDAALAGVDAQTRTTLFQVLTLLPGAVEDTAAVVELASRADRQASTASSQASLAAALLRHGQPESAAAALKKSLDAGEESVANRLFMALAQRGLGNEGEARRWVQEASAESEAPPTRQQTHPGPRWDERLVGRILRREAEGP